MTKPKIPFVDLNKFQYDLPESRIARYPAKKREESRLLFANIPQKEISHYKFSHIIDLLPENSLLAVNRTKVIPARILMRKSGGGKAEILCVKPSKHSDPVIAMEDTEQTIWNCIIGGSRIRPGSILKAEFEDICISAEILEKNGSEGICRIFWDKKISFAEALEIAGKTPLPPYIRRECEDIDKNRYQTVYAENSGSVAAPTAGLHFTPEIFDQLSRKHIEIARLTLHVGPGTFKPISSDKISEHEMHSEQFFIENSELMKIENALSRNKKIIATGTTSVRTLESLYWLAVSGQNENPMNLTQWMAYSDFGNHPQTYEAIAKFGNKGIFGNTSLMIVPGYKFKLVSGMITNFHLPGSTLILLVAAFAGVELWREIYREALANHYRFLSYGDSSLLLK